MPVTIGFSGSPFLSKLSEYAFSISAASLFSLSIESINCFMVYSFLYCLLGLTLSGLASVPLHDEGKRGKTYFRPINIANATKIPPKIKPWAKYTAP
jgi:hypothetical protein